MVAPGLIAEVKMVPLCQKVDQHKFKDRVTGISRAEKTGELRAFPDVEASVAEGSDVVWILEILRWAAVSKASLGACSIRAHL